MLEQMRDLEDNGFPADITAADEALGGTPRLRLPPHGIRSGNRGYGCCGRYRRSGNR